MAFIHAGTKYIKRQWDLENFLKFRSTLRYSHLQPGTARYSQVQWGTSTYSQVNKSREGSGFSEGIVQTQLQVLLLASFLPQSAFLSSWQADKLAPSRKKAHVTHQECCPKGVCRSRRIIVHRQIFLTWGWLVGVTGNSIIDFMFLSINPLTTHPASQRLRSALYPA